MTPSTQLPIPGSEPFIHNNDSAPAYWWIDTLWIVLADATDTGGRYSLMEELAPKGSGPGPHKHTWSDETYYMLDGEITFLVADQKGDLTIHNVVGLVGPSVFVRTRA